jgi:hypothetical protein
MHSLSVFSSRWMGSGGEAERKLRAARLRVRHIYLQSLSAFVVMEARFKVQHAHVRYFGDFNAVLHTSTWQDEHLSAPSVYVPRRLFLTRLQRATHNLGRFLSIANFMFLYYLTNEQELIRPIGFRTSAFEIQVSDASHSSVLLRKPGSSVFLYESHIFTLSFYIYTCGRKKKAMQKIPNGSGLVR